MKVRYWNNQKTHHESTKIGKHEKNKFFVLSW